MPHIAEACYVTDMAQHPFHILNVFTVANDPFSGNPLCVFEDGRPFSADQMQALARQLNLSETTFILPAIAPGATRGVRIFTPSFEMPFAGHPTLGTAHVVRDLTGGGDRVVLDMKAGLVDVTANGNDWTLRAACAPTTRTPDASRQDLARMLGIEASMVGDTPSGSNTGAEQLVIPVTTTEAVRSASPTAELLTRHAFSEKRGASMAYVWAQVRQQGRGSLLPGKRGCGRSGQRGPLAPTWAAGSSRPRDVSRFDSPYTRVSLSAVRASSDFTCEKQDIFVRGPWESAVVASRSAEHDDSRPDQR